MFLHNHQGGKRPGAGRAAFCCLMLLFILLQGITANAQQDSTWVPLKTIPVHALGFTTDNLGNIYLIRENNRLEKYDLHSDTVLTYNNIRYGRLTTADAANPLRLLLFYPDFSTIVMLDRLLSFQNKIDLKTLGIFKPDAIASAYDNNIWVYDEQQAKLKKMSSNGQPVLESVDLRQAIGEAPVPDIIVDRDGYVYLSDPEKGIFIFDYYATFKSRLPYTGIRSLQVFNNQLAFFHDGMLTVYDQHTRAEKNLPLPDAPTIIQTCVQRDRLYILRKDQLEIYPLR